MLVKSAIFSFLVVLFYLNNVCGRPAVDSDSDPLGVCYSLKCPEDTKMCGKLSEVSEEDRSKLLVIVKCFDGEGNVLKSKNLTEENPFGPNVYYKGTRFSAVVRLSPSGGDDGGDSDDSFNAISNYPKATSGPKSEVEDLNDK